MKKKRVCCMVTVLLCTVFLGGFKSAENKADDTKESETIPTYEELYEANNIKTLLDKYKNYYLSQVNYADGAVSCTAYKYNDAHNVSDVAVWPNYEAYLEYDYVLDVNNGDVAMTIYPGQENDEDTYNYLIEGTSEDEVKENEDGDYTAQKEYIMDEQDAESYGYKQGDKLSATYLFDHNTLELKNISWTVTQVANGKTEEYCDEYFYYQEPAVYPAKLTELRSGENHTLEIHMENGASRVYQVPVNVPVSFEFMDEEGKLYTDSGYTEPLNETTDVILDEDTVLYYK